MKSRPATNAVLLSGFTLASLPTGILARNILNIERPSRIGKRLDHATSPGGLDRPISGWLSSPSKEDLVLAFLGEREQRRARRPDG
jgi:hypothetical protein